ncbi:hypothetical protein lerEdw1_016801 [Lerista edwardsae]|nr:hypothetical protein lerEdw1_016801 [Lerista edwardsae]
MDETRACGRQTFSEKMPQTGDIDGCKMCFRLCDLRVINITAIVLSLSLQPFGTWKTACKNISEDGVRVVKDVLDSGYVPVLHGDCALDIEQHCCILSGDTIIEVLAKKLSPRRVVFLTDVNGIYSCPPNSPGARLLDSIVVGPDGNMEPPVLTSALPHDTTGGVLLKLQTAVNIVSQSHGAIPVLICKLDSDAAERACLTGELKKVRSVKKSAIPGVTITQFVEGIPTGCSTPDFERKPITLTLQEGKNAIFRAVVKGEPKPEVLWNCTNRELDDPQKYQISFSPSTNEFILQVNKITSDDAGLYRCTAVNEYGEATCTAGLKIIQVGFKKKGKEAASKPQGDLKKEIQDFRKTLKKLGPAAIKKEIDMEQVWQLLLNADKKDYEKICLKYGIVDFRGMLRRLQEMKKEREDKQAMYINNLVNLKHVRINQEAKNASFALEMDLKNPASRIYLYKDGQMINFGLNSDNIKHCLKQVGKKYNFIINDLQPEDAGVYQIKVEDVDVFSTELEAEHIPVSFRFSLGDVRCHEQGNAVFQCVLFDPCFNAVWLHKDRRLEPNDKYEISVSNDGLTHRLVIKNTQPSDKGTYTIDIGTRSSSAWLEVEAAKGKRKQAEEDHGAKAGLQSKLSDEDGAKKLRQGAGHGDQDDLADSQYRNGQDDRGEFYGSLRKGGSLGRDMLAGANRDGKMGQFSGAGVDMGDGTGFGGAGGLQSSTLSGAGIGDRFGATGGMGSQDAMLGNADFDSNKHGMGGTRGAGVGNSIQGEGEGFYGNGILRSTGGPGAEMGGAGSAGGLYGKDGKLVGVGSTGAGIGSDSGIYGKDSTLGGTAGSRLGTGLDRAGGLHFSDGGLGGDGGHGAGFDAAGAALYGTGSGELAGGTGGLYGKDGMPIGAGTGAPGASRSHTGGGLYGKDGMPIGAGTGGPGRVGGIGGLYGKDGMPIGAGTGGPSGVGGLYGKDGMPIGTGTGGPGGVGGIGGQYGKDGMPISAGPGGVGGLYGKDGMPIGAGTGGPGGVGGLYGKDGMPIGAGTGGPGGVGGLYSKDGMPIGAGTGGPGGVGCIGGLYGKDGMPIGVGTGGPGGVGGLHGKDGVPIGAGTGGPGGIGGIGGLYGKDGMPIGVGTGGPGGVGGLHGKDGMPIGAGTGGPSGVGGLYGKDGMPIGAGTGGPGGVGGIGGLYGKDGMPICAGPGGVGGLYGKDGMPIGASTGGPGGVEGIGGLYGKDGMPIGAGTGGPGGVGGLYGKDGMPIGTGTGGPGGVGGIGGLYGKDGMPIGAGTGGPGGVGGIGGLYGKDGMPIGAGTGGHGGVGGLYGKDGVPIGAGTGGPGEVRGLYGKDGVPIGAGTGGPGGVGGLYGKDGMPIGTGTGGPGGVGIRGLYGKDGMPIGAGTGGPGDVRGLYGKDGVPIGAGTGGPGDVCGLYGKDGMPIGAGTGGPGGVGGIGGLYGKDGMPIGPGTGGPGSDGRLYDKDGMPIGAGTGGLGCSGGIGGLYGKDGMAGGGGIGGPGGVGVYGKDGMPIGAGTSAPGSVVGLYDKDGMPIGVGTGGPGGAGGLYGKDGMPVGTGTGGPGGVGRLYGRDGMPGGLGGDVGISGLYDKDGMPIGAGIGGPGGVGGQYGKNVMPIGAAFDGQGGAGGPGGLYGKDGMSVGMGTGGGAGGISGLYGKDGMLDETGARLSDAGGIYGKDGFGGQGGICGKNSMIAGTGATGGGFGSAGSTGYGRDGMLDGSRSGVAGEGGLQGKDDMLGGRSRLGEAAGLSGKSSMLDGAGGISGAYGEARGIRGLGGKDGVPVGAGIGSGAGPDGTGGAYGKDGKLAGGPGSRLDSAGTMNGHYGQQNGILDGTSAGLAGVYGKNSVHGGIGAGLGGESGKAGLSDQYSNVAGAHASAGQSGREGMGAYPGAGASRDGIWGGSDAAAAGLGGKGGRGGLYGQDGELGGTGLGDGDSAGGISGKDAMLRGSRAAGSGLGGAGSTHGFYGKDGMQEATDLSAAGGMRGHYGKDGMLHGADGIRLGGTGDLYGQAGVLQATGADAYGGMPGLYDKDGMRGRTGAGIGLRGTGGTEGHSQDSLIGGAGAGARFGASYDKGGALGRAHGTGLGSEGGIDGLYDKDGRLIGMGAGATGLGGVEMGDLYGRDGRLGGTGVGAGDIDGSLDGAGIHAGDRRHLSGIDASELAAADLSRKRDRKGRGGALLEEDMREPHSRFSQGLFDIHAQKGKPAVLSCSLNNDNLEGTWFKDGFKVTGLDGVSIEKDGFIHKLTIDEVQDSHAGKYRFEADGIRTEASIFVEGKFDPPNVDADLLEKLHKEPIVVKAGKNAIVKIPFQGRKPIRAMWLKDDGELLDDSRISTEQSGDFTRLSISSTNRKDCGDYKVKLKNESGTAEATFKLVVIDKPQPPMGPVEVVDTSTSGITIKWKPPKDDGGKPVQSYTIEKQQVGRKTWVTLGETREGCTIFTTNKVEHDKSYYFRVKAVNSEGVSEALESDEVMAATKVFPGPPAAPKIISASKGAITLSWAAPHKTGNSRILGYTVEKCKKGSNTWTPVTDLPITDKKCTVTDLKEGLQYEFRVAAINTAGTGEASAPSEAVFARDSMKPPGPVRDLKVTSTDYTSISLAWMKPESEEESSAKGYIVEMRHSDLLKWTQCNALPIAATTYTVRGVKPREMYFLRVKALNDGGSGEPVELDTCIQAVPPSVNPKLLINDTLKSFMIIKAGNTIRVRIPFEASPTPEVIWQKDGLTLPAKATVATREGLSQLIIPGAEFSDSGHYTIILRTDRKKKESFSFLVQVIDIPESPGPIQMVEKVPDTVTLIWEPSPTEKREGSLNYMVMLRDSSKGSWQMVADLIYTNKCTVANLLPGREYFFRVLAKNYMGISDPSETVQPWCIHKTKGKYEVRLPKYKNINQNQPPRFLVPLKPHLVTVGFDCHMSCAVTGYPVPQVTWYKDGMNLSQDPTFFSKNDFGVCSLMIPGVTLSDGGLYKVVASNELGQADSKAFITVKGKE